MEKRQEILTNITDVIMDAFAMESALLRAQKLANRARAPTRPTRPPWLAACSDCDTLPTNLVVLRRFAKYEAVDSIALRRKIAHRLLDAERYIV
ncbi:MAG: hypothetical protein ABSG65_26175 [Bryobacteraceae bacterium]|jgi:hypothetical protein